jgi:PAS domain S-box-containing protein
MSLPFERPMHAAHPDTQQKNGSGGTPEMEALIGAFDWRSSPLGSRCSWSPALAWTVRLMLDARSPIALLWGNDFTFLYNDAYRALIGDKHPLALGRPAREVVAEIWETLEPMYRTVMAGEGAVEQVGQYLPLERANGLEDAWFDYTLNPVRTDDGSVRGILVIGAEVTARVRSEQAAERLTSELTVRVHEQKAELDQSEARLSLASARGAFSLAESDAEGRYTWVHNTHLDADVIALIGHRDDEVDDSAGSARLLNMKLSVVSSGETIREEIAFGSDDGRHIYDFILEPLFDSSGRVVAVTTAAFDVTRRKEIEDELRRTRDLIDGIASGTEDMIAAQDHDFRYTYFNDAYRQEFARLWGHEIQARDCMVELLAPWPNDQRNASDLWGRALSGESFITTTEFGPPDESQIYDLRFSPLRNSCGEVVGAAHIVRNVTERVSTRRALAEAEAHLTAVLDALPVGVIIADAQGKILRDNVANREIWGVPPETSSWEEYGNWAGYWPDTGQRIRPEEWGMSRALLRGEVVRGELVECEQFGSGNRRLFINNAAPVRDAEGNIIGAVVAEHDITDHITLQQALQTSEDRFRTLADNIAQLAWMADPTGAVEWFNQRWYEYTGTGYEEVKGWGWITCHPPDQREEVAERIRCCFAEGLAWEDTHPLRRHDGEYRWFLSMVLPITNEKGKIVRWFCTCTDITSQREAEEALREADRRKDDFLAMLGHELRNPISAIKMATHLIRQGTPDPARLERPTSILERQTSHILKLVDGLLEVSRISRGKIDLDQRNVDLKAILTGILEDHGPGICEQGLTLETSLPESPAPVLGDNVRLAQIFDNLLGNAVKFTDPPGTIRVKLKMDADRVVVSFTDTGRGIHPQNLASIFEPFHQETQDSSRSAGGLGLGLAVARGLVELHNGTISASSGGPGLGARFEVRLPVASEPGEESPPATTVQLAGHRILVIEDNVDIVEMLTELLGMMGHTARNALDGADALELLRREDFDLVLCDIGLPGMSGYDIIREIRSDPALRHLTVVALTGYGSPDDIRRTADAGFDHHLVKPLDFDAFGDLLARIAG